jgi:uncharacterized protein YjdB
MFNRLCFAALFSACLAGSLTGCNSTSLPNGLTVTPATASISGVGSTEQLTATGQYGSSSHHTYQDISGQVTWASTSTSVATVSSSGLVTAVAAGSTQITASIPGYGGTLSASSTITVSVTGGTGSTGDVTSLTLVPATLSVAAPGQTGQFVVIGNTSGGGSVNVNGKVTWSSSSVSIASVDASSGLVTGVGQGTATITALYTNADNSPAYGTGTFTVQNSASQGYSALTVIPNSQAATYQTQQSQFKALATKASNNEQYDITSLVTWASTNTTVATIGSLGSANPGLATAVGTGNTTITATYLNADGSEVVAQASYSVSIGNAQEPLISIQIYPNEQLTVSNIGMTQQYLAIGTFSTTPTVRDLTDYVQWISFQPNVASINSNTTTGGQITATTGTTPLPGSNNLYNYAGLATSEGYAGDTYIDAEAINPDGTVVFSSNSPRFTCSNGATPPVCVDVYPPSQFVTITVFNAGPNESTWYVTAPSDTGTADLIHCGPGWTGSGGSVCTGVYAYDPNATIKLTETSPANSFGGWNMGSNCEEGTYSTTCTVSLGQNESVGAIFY